MDSYRSLFERACWAALVCWLAGTAARNAEQGDRAQGLVAACVVVIEGELARLEARVEPFLAAYRETLMPELERWTPDAEADQ